MTPESSAPGNAAATDRLLDTLSSAVRREVIAYFENRGETETVAIAELVAHVAGRIPSKCGESAHVELRHVHLPKLDDRGWLDYDGQTGTVRYHGQSRAKPLLRAVEERF